MKTILKWLIFLGVGIGIGIVLYQDPGYVLFSYSGWVLEMPLLLAGFLILLLVIVFYFLLRTGHFVFALPERIKNWFSRRKQYIAWRKTLRGSVAFFAGNFSRAESLLQQSVTRDTALFCHLACAHAALKQGAIERRDHYLQLAHKTANRKQAMEELAVGMTTAQLQFSHKQYEQCLALVLRLRQIAPKHPAVLKLLKELYLALSDWKGLLPLLPLLLKYSVISDDEQNKLRIQIYRELLGEALHQTDLGEAQRLWREIPTYLQQDPSLQNAFANVLFQLPEHTLLEGFIRRALSWNWDGDLVMLYGLLNGTAVHKQLTIAEKWLEDHPRDSELLLCLGRLCLKNQLWGKAKRYFETSIQIFPTPRAYYELACLQEALKEEETSHAYFKRGLELAIGTVPQLPLPAITHPTS